ncbi:hypothetical protein IFR05_010755 [Cadophora sp. M221]|nr:hypothetical protein IFR05_010755 [Cadophora sp. M221]
MQVSCLTICVVIWFSTHLASSQTIKHPLFSPNNQSEQLTTRKRVAIIGAGLAGATASYYLHDSIRELHDIDITIFESSLKIGGRIKSVKYRGRTIEIGAPAASTHDWCFLRAMKDVVLAPKEPDWDWKFHIMRTVGVWNGAGFVSTGPHEPRCSTWWELMKMVWREGRTAWLLRKVSLPHWVEVGKLMWKYGLSPWTFERATLSDLKTWDSFGADLCSRQTHTFGSLNSELRRAGLPGEVLGSAGSYFRSLNLSAAFLNEVIEPYARARFGQNLENVRGFAAEIAYREFFSRSVAVSDGNYRLVDRLITLSRAHLNLNSRIKEIRNGHSKRYSLLSESHSAENTVVEQWEEFDAVVIATPLQLGGIVFDGSLNIKLPLEPSPPFLERHITHFVSEHYPSPNFFNLSSSTHLPNSILTTANNSNIPDIFNIDSIGNVVRIDRAYCPSPWLGEPDDCDATISEGIFRIISSDTIDNQILFKMIGSPSDFEFPFLHRQVWPFVTPAYVNHLLPIDDVELAPSLYYTGGGDDLFSSLEMSCRMGFNVGVKAFFDLDDALR